MIEMRWLEVMIPFNEGGVEYMKKDKVLQYREGHESKYDGFNEVEWDNWEDVPTEIEE